MSPINLASLVPPVGMLYGAFYFGTVMSTAFYGVTCMQTFLYYIHYRNDSLRMKLFVAVLWSLDTCHEALAISGTYKYFSAGLMGSSALFNGSPDFVLQLLFSVAIAVPAQGFLVYLIYNFSKKKIIVPIIWIPLAVVQLASASIYVRKALYNMNGNLGVVPLYMLNDKSFTTLASLILSAAAVADVLIAVGMMCLLTQTRYNAQVARRAHMLQYFILFSVNTGIWMTVFALSTLILLHAFPNNVLYTVPGIPVCAIYCNTLLANLNARTVINGGDARQSIDLDLFAHSNWYVSDNTGNDRQQESIKLNPGTQEGTWKTRGGDNMSGHSLVNVIC